MKVVDLPKKDKKDLEDTLSMVKEHLAEIDDLVILALDDQGRSRVYSAGLNHIEKCYLAKAYDSVLLNWFEELPKE